MYEFAPWTCITTKVTEEDNSTMVAFRLCMQGNTGNREDMNSVKDTVRFLHGIKRMSGDMGDVSEQMSKSIAEHVLGERFTSEETLQ